MLQMLHFPVYLPISVSVCQTINVDMLGEPQLNDLWDDIMDIQKNGTTYRPHYTGAITLQQIDLSDLTPAERKLSASGMEYYNVVDGQQRLTTLVILLNTLVKRITKGKNN